MKNIINSIQENAMHRLKNPLIGAFVFSWTIWNSSDLLMFLLSDNSSKMEIIKQSSFNMVDDIWAPSGLTILYLLFIPALNMLHERMVDGFINKHRNIFKQKTLQEHYVTVKETVIAKLDSDEEEIKKIRDRQLDKWSEEKKEMQERVKGAMESYADRLSKIDKQTEAYRTTINEKSSEIYELNSENTAYKREIQRLVDDINTEIEVALEVVDLPKSTKESLKKIRALTAKTDKSVANILSGGAKGDWGVMDFDDDIPF
ncbi:hypothetical protein RQY88_004426 [Vibrio vulnificus]|nr:hypothetical protein [Vibrio vulnificus]ELH9603090.1 hypothetical protein [Vibrio vulnificus]ELH9617431.1 hypothetical protein [Vibrio vulnificus]